jgi:tRNA 2-thiocytidine biosynthesis protein TtcA
MKKPNQFRLAFWLLKDINRAIHEFSMIKDGDRIAVAVSGGKDSYSLLRLLDVRRIATREKYDLMAIHIIGDSAGPGTIPHPPLLDWLEQSGFEFSIVPLVLPQGETLPLDCRRCTWNRRKMLFETALRCGCNVVAFGHHADDLAQTTLLNLLFHGSVETMSPHRIYFDGKIRIIRPLCYTAEKDIRRFAKESRFPPPPPNCSRSEHSRRKLVADLIRQVEPDCKNAKINLLRAGLRNTHLSNDDSN